MLAVAVERVAAEDGAVERVRGAGGFVRAVDVSVRARRLRLAAA
jgi:hypothetical protein